MQIPISDSRGDNFTRMVYVGHSDNVLVVNRTLDDDPTLVFAASQAVPRQLNYDLNYHLQKMIQVDPAPVAGEADLSLWSLTSIYVGMETQNTDVVGNVFGTIHSALQVSDISVVVDQGASYAGHNPFPTPPSQEGRLINFTDATTGLNGVAEAFTFVGGVDYLQLQYLYFGSDNMAFSTDAQNIFLHSGSGNDAIAIQGGHNVIDAGTGSNFIVGGSGTDTFFLDARAPGIVWDTIVNFHVADAVTLWGFVPGESYAWWDGISGASGYQGATLRISLHGSPLPDASITFSGLSSERANGLWLVTGTQDAGSYLYIYNPDV